jgi:hypothetical protein
MKKLVQDKLAEIYERDGALMPGAVVSEARVKGSPLHDCFTWDDSKAAEAHRLNQARALIRVAVRVIPAISNSPVREYISISSLRQTKTGSYLATVDVVSDEERYAQALQDAIKALQQLERRFNYLKELAPIWDALTPMTAQAEAA